jgi:hypothetical protein
MLQGNDASKIIFLQGQGMPIRPLFLFFDMPRNTTSKDKGIFCVLTLVSSQRNAVNSHIISYCSKKKTPIVLNIQEEGKAKKQSFPLECASGAHKKGEMALELTKDWFHVVGGRHPGHLLQCGQTACFNSFCRHLLYYMETNG